MSREQRPVVGDGARQLEAGQPHARFGALQREPFPPRVFGLTPRVFFRPEFGMVVVHPVSSRRLA